MSDEQGRWTRRRLDEQEVKTVGTGGEKIALADNHLRDMELYLWFDGEVTSIRYREGRQNARTDIGVGINPYRGNTNGKKPLKTNWRIPVRLN